MHTRSTGEDTDRVPLMDMEWGEYLAHAGRFVQAWETPWGSFDSHPALALDRSTFEHVWQEFSERLHDNYPFFHRRYAGQMLKPPHPAAAIAYIATLFVNPNNHALDGGPATAQMEREVVADLAHMFGLKEPNLGHLTSSGTIANLEAIWVGRELAPGSSVAFSEAAHYTHSRMCSLLGVDAVEIPSDRFGRMDVTALEEALAARNVGTVVATAGTTGTGSVDPIREIAGLRDCFGFRLHVDAAYGGFFALLARDVHRSIDGTPFLAIASADSIAIDPHKHGLQPYGCGCVLFADPEVGKLYRHDSPYTYFTSDELHLGEISLECSRAGAAAAALWFTLRCFPLQSEGGLADALRAGRSAALAWTERIRESDLLHPWLDPDLDIVCFYPYRRGATVSSIDAWSQRIFERLMDTPEDPIFLGVFRVSSEDLAVRSPDLVVDQPTCRILRSVLMKPEHESFVNHLHTRVELEASRTEKADGAV